jgi:hypothetical protein
VGRSASLEVSAQATADQEWYVTLACAPCSAPVLVTLSAALSGDASDPGDKPWYHERELQPEQGRVAVLVVASLVAALAAAGLTFVVARRLLAKRRPTGYEHVTQSDDGL